MDLATARILDANLNRAREALRVIEDYARFALNDLHAVSRLKRMRHAIKPLCDQLSDAGLCERDLRGDVGARVKTSSEVRRDSAEHVVRAAFARWSEASRVLGEFGKLASPEFAAAAESLRYDGYELEQRLILRGQPMLRLREAGLYIIITEALCARPWIDTAVAVLRGGARCVQLREKALSDGELLSRARRLREMTRASGCLLVVNDRPDIARLCDADGVHVGQDDVSVADARRAGGGRLIVGKSTHTPEQFAAALREEPDYVALGPMFASTTKPQERLAGPPMLASLRGSTTLPIVAIGGIEIRNASEIRSAGADLVCVCSAVISSEDAERATRELVSAAYPYKNQT